MRVLDLFSGIGGFSLGFEAAGFETVAFCENDPYCQAVLKKNFPGIPIIPDIYQFKPEGNHGAIQLICGGYPCQPFSFAGKRRGEKDSRYIWPEMLRIIRVIKPEWVVCENVLGHVEQGFENVATQMENENYTVWPFVVPACAVGAQHHRERLWIVAHSNSYDDWEAKPCRDRKKEEMEAINRKKNASTRESIGTGDVFWNYAVHKYPGTNLGLWMRRILKWGFLRGAAKDTECRLGRIIDGVPTWMDGINNPGMERIVAYSESMEERNKALGNAIVPHIAYYIGEAIKNYNLQKGILND
ncbi:MAG: DNA cytosine methyltransferase [Alphaproteobacteria bacterium]|nr:DNA cytosine methyltransferase [Alphaproteobacteria bacterium]